MAFLLDTDIVIDYLGGDASTRAHIGSLTPSGIAIGAIMHMEVFQGILEAPDPVAAQRTLSTFLAGVPLFPVDQAVAERCARLRSELKRQGKRVRPRALDLIAAAIALEHGHVLVTRNRDDYDDIPGLQIR
jgi:tRNA(fMet)-specific endonuclease VapC